MPDNDPTPAADLTEPSHDEPAAVARDAIVTPLDRLLDARRAPEAKLAHVLDEIEAWAKHIEERLARLEL